LNPEILQLFIILTLGFPFLIPFFKKWVRSILFAYVGLSFLFLVFFYLNRESFPIHFVFGGWSQSFGIEVVFSQESLLFIATTNIVFLSVLFVSLSPKKEWHYYFLLNLLHADITCLFVANDLFNIYVTLELLSLLCYLLISIELQKRQIWSSLKYMILGAIGFNLYLIGTAILYGETGTLNLTTISSLNYDNYFAIIMIMIPLLIKSEVFFFSMWVPSAQTESEGTVSAILSAVVVNAGLFHLFRLSNALHSQMVQIFLLIIGLSTILFGAVFSLFQRDMKMILAFSTMSNVGFVLILLTDIGMAYACSHSLYKSLLFLTVGYFITISGSKDCKKPAIVVPISLYVAFITGFLSLAGIPYFIGGVFKHQIIFNNHLITSLLLLLISILSIVPLIRIFVLMKPGHRFFSKPFVDIGLLILSFVVLFFGIRTTINYFSYDLLMEAFIVLGISFAVFIIFSKRVNLFYPYKLFKLSNSLAIYSFMIGIIITLSLLA